MHTPTDVCNEALDAIGSETVIGNIEDGTRAAQVCLRQYPVCLRQLLRSAHWAFARKTAPLLLLADASGQTQSVGSTVQAPWIYEYSYPTDCMKLRFIPLDRGEVPIPAGNIQSPWPVSGVSVASFVPGRIAPARFLVAMDANYPPAQGQEYWQVQGQSPQGRTVILTNVKDAHAVYTALMLYPSTWDPLFRAAMVAYLAEKIALPLSKDKKFGLAIRAQQIALVKDAVAQARAADGNEAWNSTDHVPDWIAMRRTGAYAGYSGLGPGTVWGAWDSLSFTDGSLY